MTQPQDHPLVPEQTSPSQGESALTCIHPTYTLASHTEPGSNEVDAIMVKHFANVLAEIALAVASREVKQ